jgi:hypothetical protein
LSDGTTPVGWRLELIEVVVASSAGGDQCSDLGSDLVGGIAVHLLLVAGGLRFSCFCGFPMVLAIGSCFLVKRIDHWVD